MLLCLNVLFWYVWWKHPKHFFKLQSTNHFWKELKTNFSILSNKLFKLNEAAKNTFNSLENQIIHKPYKSRNNILDKWLMNLVLWLTCKIGELKLKNIVGYLRNFSWNCCPLNSNVWFWDWIEWRDFNKIPWGKTMTPRKLATRKFA